MQAIDLQGSAVPMAAGHFTDLTGLTTGTVTIRSFVAGVSVAPRAIA
jgi:hypothetical protein